MIWLVLAFVGLGLFFTAVATLGMMRLPDFYSRSHMVGKTDTAGIILVLTGVAISEGFTLTSVKLACVIAFYFAANPAAAHALGNAALRRGLAPWTRRDRT